MKQVLIVEDDGDVVVTLKKVFKQYETVVAVRTVADAGAAVQAIEEKEPDLLVLDLMMPYGTAGDLLQGRTDPGMRDTGIRLLEWIRSRESKGQRMWVAVTTARSEADALRRVSTHLESGTGRLFPKPYDDLEFEVYVCRALQIDCRLPAELVGEILEASEGLGSLR